jgi:DTW domain-containing protein YfiP
VVCWCAALPSIDAATPVLILQHPREEDMPIGTARMAALCLRDAELVVGVDLDGHPRVRSVLDDPTRTPILLWPGPGARDLEEDPPSGPTTLVVVDGTWALAKKLVRVNPRLASLPRYAFRPPAPSGYKIRREPRAECVSTIEAVMYALGAIERAPERFAPMLAPFRAMVDAQVHYRDHVAEGRHQRASRGPRPARAPSELGDRRRIVLVAGEANAWPHPGHPAPGEPPRERTEELVHWVACRLDTGEVLERVLRPRKPLCHATLHHARLEERALAEGTSVDELVDAWRAFVRDDDVIVGWGHYAAGLFEREGGTLPSCFVDLRRLVASELHEKPRALEERARLHAEVGPPLGVGRAGERIAQLRALTEALLEGRLRRVAPRDGSKG